MKGSQPRLDATLTCIKTSELLIRGSPSGLLLTQHRDPWITRLDLRIKSSDPRITSSDPGITSFDPWITRFDLQITIADPRITNFELFVFNEQL